MKTALLLHGTGGSDQDYFWFTDTKQFLEEQGYEVWRPLLPNTDQPKLEETVDFIVANMPALDEDSIIIGHSSACPAILYLLQDQLQKVGLVVLVSGFYQKIDEDGISELMLPDEGFDYPRIASSVERMVLINSDNDPWGCDDKQARPAAEALDASFILAEGEGHMGSLSFNQPYREFPLLKQVIESNL